MIDEARIEQRFTVEDVRRMHRVWLREIYSWAGEYRQVNMSKGEFMFAAADQVPRLMQELERGPLREYTPCRFDNAREQATALAVVHAELILVHPFREGNGRCSRLLAILMGLQAGLPALDFGGIRGVKKREYIAAVHAALSRDYAPMTRVFESVIARTLRLVAKPSSGPRG
jgi:cell filamentation protein